MRNVVLIGIIAGCRQTDVVSDLSCTAAVDDNVSTMIHLDWQAPEGSLSWAEFSGEETLDLSTEVTASIDVDVPLLGMPPDTEVHWTGISERGGERRTCSGVTRTEPLPDGVPTWTVSVDAAEASRSPAFLMGVVYDSQGDTHLTAIDRQGRVVWYGPMDEDGIAIQAELSLDGRGVYYSHLGKSADSSPSAIRLVSLDWEPLDERLATSLHHMFVQLPDQVIAFQQLDIREFYNEATGVREKWTGDSVWELDAAGGSRQVFSAWDWLTPTENPRMYAESTYDLPDWTHGNGLKYDPETARYLLSLGNVADVIEFDRETGVPTRIFGTDGYHTPDGASFTFQHDPTLLDNGNLTLYVTDPVTEHVGAIEYQVDDARQFIVPVWSYDSGAPGEYLGQVRRLDSGNTLLNLGAAGRLLEVTPDVEIVWEASPDGGFQLGQFQLLDSLYAEPHG